MVFILRGMRVLYLAEQGDQIGEIFDMRAKLLCIGQIFFENNDLVKVFSRKNSPNDKGEISDKKKLPTIEIHQ
jgi:hypothetical protein